MSDGYLILDDEDRIVQSNPAAERILRRAVGDDSVFGDGVAGADAAAVFDRVCYADRHGEFEGEFALESDDEATRYVSVETADLEDDGFVIGRLLILRDVTERVRTRNALRQERDELDTLFANISDPAAEVEFDGDNEPVVQRVNPAFEEVFGYDESRLRGERIDDYIVPEGRDDNADEMNHRAAEEEDVKAEVIRETTDGERAFLLQVAVPDRQHDAAFALYTDISDRKERKRELERQNERLEEFASMVSHDLRNPLNVAKEYLAIARRADDPEEFVAEAETSLDRMEAMIADVLTLAREGRDVAEPDDVDLDAVAEMAWNNCDTAEATLRVADSTRLRADPDRLMELLENLFRNSVEHSSTDSRSQTGDSVEHSSTDSRSQTGDSVEHSSTDSRSQTGDSVGHGSDSVAVTVGSLDGPGFYVADDGPGIPDHVREEVFDHGVTTAEEGTGFGLAIVDRIASAHGWEARATASESGGARFEFLVDGDR
jgi:PAS domain S-box-containing protein